LAALMREVPERALSQEQKQGQMQDVQAPVLRQFQIR
jgi:hypothetical protein